MAEIFPSLPEHRAFLNSLTPREMRDVVIRLAVLAGDEAVTTAIEMTERARTEACRATYQVSCDGEPVGEPFSSETDARAFAEEKARTDGWPGDDMDFQWWNADQADWRSPLHLYAVCDGHDDATGYVITRVEQSPTTARQALAARVQDVADAQQDAADRADLDSDR